MITTTLEDRGYVATEKDVAGIAASVLRADSTLESGRCSYLRVLIGTTQSELTEGVDALYVLHGVHRRFYAQVVKVTSRALPADMPDRADELNRRTNYARTAAYAIRTWLKAGNDIRALDAKVATKALLATAPPKTPRSEMLVARAHRQADGLLESLKSLGIASLDEAVEETRRVIAALAAQLMTLQGVEEVTREDTAAAA